MIAYKCECGEICEISDDLAGELSFCSKPSCAIITRVPAAKKPVSPEQAAFVDMTTAANNDLIPQGQKNVAVPWFLDPEENNLIGDR